MKEIYASYKISMTPLLTPLLQSITTTATYPVKWGGNGMYWDVVTGVNDYEMGLPSPEAFMEITIHEPYCFAEISVNELG